MRPSTSTNRKLPLRCTAAFARNRGKPMNRTSAKTPAMATEPAHEGQLPDRVRVDRGLQLSAIHDDLPGERVRVDRRQPDRDGVVALAAHHHAFDDSLAAIEKRLFTSPLAGEVGFPSLLAGKVARLACEPGRRGGFVYRLRRGRFRRRHLRPGLSSPLAEPLDLPARVNDPLRAREEWVAYGADLGLQLLARGTRRESVPASAGDDRVFVEGGVNL